MKNEEVMDAATRANRRKRQKGVTIVEYAIMLALIAIAVARKERQKTFRLFL